MRRDLDVSPVLSYLISTADRKTETQNTQVTRTSNKALAELEPRAPPPQPRGILLLGSVGKRKDKYLSLMSEIC